MGKSRTRPSSTPAALRVQTSVLHLDGHPRKRRARPRHRRMSGYGHADTSPRYQYSYEPVGSTRSEASVARFHEGRR